MQTIEQNLYVIFKMQACDAPTISSRNASISTRTSAWFGLFLLFGLDLFYQLQAHDYALEGETLQSEAEKMLKNFAPGIS